MKRALIITIGSRDVIAPKPELVNLFGEETIQEFYKQNPRYEDVLSRPLGQFLNGPDQYKKAKKAIQLPIISSFLKFVTPSKTPFDEVFLVATNQNPDEVGSYAEKDTKYFAELIKKLFSDKDFKKNYEGLGNINIIEIKQDVVYLDSMFQHFREMLNDRKGSLRHLFECDEIHILNQGGIDAINYGLLLNALYLFHERVRLYNVNEHSKMCTQLEFGVQFGQEQEKIHLRNALKRYDYAAIKHLKLPDVIKAWAAYGEARLNFDFDMAYRYLAQTASQYRHERDQELMDIDAVRQNEELLTGELYWNASIRFQQEAYVDFVQRFFRIVEQIAKSESMKHLNFVYENNKWKETFGPFVNAPANQELKSYLDAYRLHGNPLDYLPCTSNANIAIFKAILEYYAPNTAAFLKKIEPLSRLRNRGIGAHGFNPISLENILEATQTDQTGFEALLEETATYLNVRKNAFDRINKIILKMPIP